ncbi:MAG: 16S rRNA (cytidine(1402)-2'-O)-methyltransferase [Moorellales bacterium]
MSEETRPAGTGTLYVCPTPIGNLEDITIRTLKVLRRVHLIAAEDTRKVRILLERYRVRVPVISYHQHNEARRTEYLLSCLREGRDVALVSEAGTPGISDPGGRVLEAAIGEGLPVVVLPGPTALIPALLLSGLPARRFAFEGFLPRQPGKRRKYLESLAREERTLVLYEAPHRLEETLADLLAVLGNRRAAVARELSKVHEEVVRGPLAFLLEHFRLHPPRGELVVVVEGDRAREDHDWDRLVQEVAERRRAGLPLAEAVRVVAKSHGVGRRELYRLVLEQEAAPPEEPPP